MGTIESMHGTLPESPANISHQHRCIFVHVPKAAGTSIKRVFDMQDQGHLPWSYYALCYPELWRQYTSFAVVRNPWDRLVSVYHFARKLADDHDVVSSKSFEECVTLLHEDRDRLKNVVWHTQTRWVAAPKSLGGKIMVDRILRFEHIERDFHGLLRYLGVPRRGLPRINTTDRLREYRQYYDDRTRKLVEQVYGADIETFGYSF